MRRMAAITNLIYLDGMSTAARTWLEGVCDDRGVSFKLSNGFTFQGVLHDSLQVSEARNLCGRRLDLDAAYKQMLTSKSSVWCSVLAIEDEQHFNCLCQMFFFLSDLLLMLSIVFQEPVTL